MVASGRWAGDVAKPWSDEMWRNTKTMNEWVNVVLFTWVELSWVVVLCYLIYLSVRQSSSLASWHLAVATDPPLENENGAGEHEVLVTNSSTLTSTTTIMALHCSAPQYHAGHWHGHGLPPFPFYLYGWVRIPSPVLLNQQAKCFEFEFEFEFECDCSLDQEEEEESRWNAMRREWRWMLEGEPPWGPPIFLWWVPPALSDARLWGGHSTKATTSGASSALALLPLTSFAIGEQPLSMSLLSLSLSLSLSIIYLTYYSLF